MRRKILIVEDEAAIAQGIAFNLRQEGFDAFVAPDGQTAQRVLRQEYPDLVLLDLMLPDVDGVSFCRALRAESDVPILMVTARGEESDKIMGLEAGADDYITKPFSIGEMIARIKAALRRAGAAGPATQRMRRGRVLIDRETRSVVVDGKPVDLRRREFDLLWTLVSHPGRVYSREDLFEIVWSDREFVDPGTLDVHIRRLREKVEENPGTPRHIVTVRGVGYKFDPAGAEE